MTESNVTAERLQKMLDAEIPLGMSVADAREIITLAQEALALRTPSDAAGADITDELEREAHALSVEGEKRGADDAEMFDATAMLLVKASVIIKSLRRRTPSDGEVVKVGLSRDELADIISGADLPPGPPEVPISYTRDGTPGKARAYKQADAVLAALALRTPSDGEVVVKSLDWVEDNETATASALGLAYNLFLRDGVWKGYAEGYESWFLDPVADLSVAKAAAFEHHQARILSALTPGKE